MENTLGNQDKLPLVTALYTFCIFEVFINSPVSENNSHNALVGEYENVLKMGCRFIPGESDENIYNTFLITGEDGLDRFCRERMSTIKCLWFIEFRDSLPRSATGKLFNRKQKNEYWPQLQGEFN